MSTYAFPSGIIATTSSFQLLSNQQEHISGWNNAVQVMDRGGEHWVFTFHFNNLKGDAKGELKGFLGRLNGRQHRFTIHDHGHTQRGSAGGGVTVSGAGQTGTTLNISGASANWLKAGDWFAVDGRLKLVTVDCPGSTISFIPRITTAPSSGASLDDSDPAGTFMLADDGAGWTNRPNGLSDFVLNCIEDVLI